MGKTATLDGGGVRVASDGTLRIADGLSLPPGVVTETLLILAKRGSGKTYAASVLVEEMITAGLPVCVIDPVGVWWGLRSSADGTGPGMPVTILGGEHADLPLPAGSGMAVASLLVAERLPMVLDLSGMSKTAQRRFMVDFLECLYHRNREPLHLVVDEADLFAPLRGGKDTMRLLGAYEDVVRRGRAHGLGCTSITQRPASLHTDIRSQAEVLIALRMIGTHDVAAIDEWVRLHATDAEARELKASLPSLPVGTAWVWSPGWLEILVKVQVRSRRTFDSSATPKAGQRLVTPREFARVNPADLERMAASLQADVTPDDAAGGDVRALRGQVRELRAALEQAEARVPVTVTVEVPVLAPGDIAALEQAITALRDVAGSFELALARVTQTAGPAAAPHARPVPRKTATPVPAVVVPEGVHLSLGKSHRAILTVLAQHSDGRTKRQLAMLAGYSANGGGFNNALSALRTAGLIGRGEPIRATTAGLDTLGGDWEPLPTGPGLADYWTGQLGKAEGLILRALLDAWPGALTKAEVAERTGYAPDGGGFGNALSRLRTLQLIGGRGELRADETLAREATGVSA